MNRFNIRCRILLLGCLAPASAALLHAQNTWNVVANHPRLMINNSVPDTWEPAKDRLSAIVERCTGGNLAATNDFNYVMSLAAPPTPQFANFSNEDGNLNLLLVYALSYAIHHKAGNEAVANPYAAAAWAGMQNLSGVVYPVTSIVTDAQGIATVTLASQPNPPIQVGMYRMSVWGVSNDAMNGPVKVLSASGNTVTYPTTVASATFTGPGMLAGESNGGYPWIGATGHGESGRALAQWAYFYDWCYDWLVANGHDQYARNQLKAGYWASTLTRQSSQFSQTVRESDFHNYTSWYETAILEAGIALYGDDPLGASVLDEGVGYFWAGARVQPAGVVSPAETFTYNLKASTDQLTNGAMNWEGPAYWRSGTIRFLRALEAFDAATARANGVWTQHFPQAHNAGMYKIYVRDPAGNMANLGDAGNNLPMAGRDNFGLAIVNDRFPDPHFVWMLDNDTPYPWDSGSGGSTGIVYKLIYYPYVNGPGSHDPSDLPLAATFGPDTFLRTGWGPNDAFITYTTSLRGTYHRRDDAGTFTIYRNGYLVTAQNYLTLNHPVYDQFNRRAIGANVVTVYDPSDCWKDTGPNCGIDAYGRPLINDGGQLTTSRRFHNQFTTSEFQISRAWSGSVYTDPQYSALYGEMDYINQPNLTLGSGYEHIQNDLTKSYVNSYSGSGDNPHAKVVSPSGVLREIIHFQPTLGTLSPVVVYDKVTSTNASFLKTWRVHTIHPPEIYHGRWSTPAAGSTTYTGGTMMQTTNGTGRLFLTSLLPSKPSMRTVGGNACAPIVIQNATNANPAVFYAPAHGLKAGENIGIDVGTFGAGGYLSNWFLEYNVSEFRVDTVPDPDHFTLRVLGASSPLDSTRAQPFATTYNQQGTGAPVAPGAYYGQMYYQTDAANGNTAWIWSGSAWLQNKNNGTGYVGAVIYSHASCNWAYYADQYGPAGSGGASFWESALDNIAVNARTNWRLEIRPSAPATTDYFLNVLTPTTTAVTTPPTATLITRTSRTGTVYGAQIVDSNGTYVAVFGQTSGKAGVLEYGAPHHGAGKHVVSGLVAGKYVVTQEGRVLGAHVAGNDGTISFSETGGGEFQVTPEPAVSEVVR